MIKTCVICGKEFNAKSGAAKTCPGECRTLKKLIVSRIYNGIYRKNNRETIKKNWWRHFNKNPERYKESSRCRYKNNSDNRKAAARIRYYKNPERHKSICLRARKKRPEYYKELKRREWLRNARPNKGSRNFLQTLKLGSTLSKIENENTNHRNP